MKLADKQGHVKDDSIISIQLSLREVLEFTSGGGDFKGAGNFLNPPRGGGFFYPSLEGAVFFTSPGRGDGYFSPSLLSFFLRVLDQCSRRRSGIFLTVGQGGAVFFLPLVRGAGLFGSPPHQGKAMLNF